MLSQRTFPASFFLASANFNSHVTKALKSLMKNVQTNEDLDVDENELENLVCLLYNFLVDFLLSLSLMFS
jgi:hypothetical protein